MEMLIAVVALSVAIWQLQLQRNEIRLNGRLNSLIHMATLVKDRIDSHERIIENLKEKKLDFRPHASRVNGTLKPLLLKINNELVATIEHHRPDMNVDEIRQALRMIDSIGD